MVQPSIQVIDVILHACYAVIIHPSPDINLYLFKTRSDALTAFTGRVFTQLVFELLHRLWMNADIYSPAILPQRKAEKLKISDCKHADHTAFLLIYLQFQSPFQILRARLQESLCRSFTLRQQYDVVCIAYAWNSSSQIFLVELIEVDVSQQGGKIPPLCGEKSYVELKQKTMMNTVFHA